MELIEFVIMYLFQVFFCPPKLYSFKEKKNLQSRYLCRFCIVQVIIVKSLDRFLFASQIKVCI